MTTHFEATVPTQEIRAVQPADVSNDLPNLDFLRAVAELLVLFGHLTYFRGLTDVGPLKTYWMGDLGVKMFFLSNT
jgi:peptidoglycan/LPS O-acetylase OafA/YrhL